MKHTKKLIVAVLAAVTAMALCVPALAFAADTPTKGTITIENATKNQEYKAYKIFNAYVDSTGEKVNYTVAADKKDLLDENSPFEVGIKASDGGYNVTVKEGVEDSEILQWINDNKSSFDTGASGTFNEAGSTVTFSDLDFGYYFISSGLGAAVTIDTLGPTATFQDKNYNDSTTPTKVITAVDGDAADLESAEVGSIVSFKLTFNAVNWKVADGIDDPLSIDEVTPVAQTEYAIVDTPVNMTILNTTANPITVKVGEETITNFTFDNNTFTIPWAEDLDADGKWVDGTSKFLYAPAEGASTIPVEITYDAQITQAAADEGASNTVGETIVEVDTYKFQLDKVDASYNDLTGAKFQLKSGDTLIKFSIVDGAYVVDPAGTVEEIDLTSNSKAVIKGLKHTAYTLVETQAPGGYNEAAPQEVAADDLVKYDVEIVDNAGIDSDTGVVSVVNRQGVELPSTGGIGTTIFYVIGGILIAVAAVFLITRKRVANARKEDEEI